MAQVKKSGWITFIVIILCIAGAAYYKFGYMVYKDYEYYTHYADVHGLQRSSPIMIDGVRIGEVSDIELNGKGLATVTMSIDKKVRIPKGTIAKLASASLLDSKNITLEPGKSKEYYAHLDIIPGLYDTSVLEMTDQINPIVRSAKYFISTSDTNLTDLKNKFKNGLTEEARKSIASISKDMTAFEKNSQSIAKGAEAIMSNVRGFSKASASLSKDVQSLNKDIRKTDSAMEAFANAPIIATTHSVRSSIKSVQKQAVG